MLTRVKTFAATGVAPNGRLYAGDLNAIQDAVAAQSDFAQTVGVGTLQIGETGLALNRYGAGEARITGKLRADGGITSNDYVDAASIVSESGGIWSQRPNPTQVAFASYVGIPGGAVDARNRFDISAEGAMRWGPGSVDPDTNLYRFAANFLGTTTDFGTRLGSTAQVTFQSSGGSPIIYFGNAQDTNLYREAIDKLRTDDQFRALRIITGTGLNEIDLWDSGKIYFSNLGDTNLYRDSAGALRTDGRFLVNGDISANLNTANQIWLSGDGRIYFGNANDTSLYRSAVNTLRTPGNLIVDGNVTITGTISGGGAVPSGAMMQFGGAAAPTGWLLADGTAVSRTTYAALFAAIGTAYGTGDGSTTFNLPNLKTRVPRGFDASTTSVNALGKTGGVETVALSVAELAAHAHGVTEAAHNHTVNNPAHGHTTNGVAIGGHNPNASGTVGVMGSNEAYENIPINLQVSNGTTSVSANAASTGVSIQNNGSGSAHNNLSPYVTVNYIIKT